MLEYKGFAITYTWEQAHERCQSWGEGSNLVTLGNEEDYDAIQAAIKEANITGWIWTGARYDVRTKSWFWYDDDSYSTFFPWAVNEPGTKQANDTCGAYNPKQGNAGLYSQNCGKNWKAFVCQKVPTPKTNTWVWVVIACVGLCLLLSLLLGLLYCCKRRKGASHKNETTNQNDSTHERLNETETETVGQEKTKEEEDYPIGTPITTY